MGSAPQPAPDSRNARSMADAPNSRPAGDPQGEPSVNGSGSLEELRHLILAPEQEALERLQQRIEDPESRAEDVSGVVAEAIQRRREQGGSDALSDALAPTIETALRESVRKDPKTLASALFPVMGPAIRRSILETLRSFLDSFNQVLDQSLSWQGLKWRFEAIRTGRSFTEVALLHSLVFRVEQVFLIHKTTGLPIAHSVAPAVAIEDPSLVSGMLSAIQDFVRDSFHSEQGQTVNRMNVGDLEVWVETGPYAILAAVIRGVAPRTVRDQMAESLETLHAEYAEQFRCFSGDTAPFAEANKELSRCLGSKFKEEKQPRGYGYSLAAGIVLLALLGAWLGWRFSQYRRWSELSERLANQPGLTVTSFAREHGHFVIRGLRDPLASDPLKFVRDAGLDPSGVEFHWGSYYALDDFLVEQRARAVLAPPGNVVLTVKDGVLHVDGTPSAQWLNEVPARALLIPGVRVLDLGRWSPEQVAFDDARNKLEVTVIRFPLASSTFSAAGRSNLRNLLPSIEELLNPPVSLHRAVRVDIVGHSDSSGAEVSNQSLSQRRAERVLRELQQLGIATMRLHAQGVATADPVRAEDSEENRQYNRSVTFRVTEVPPGQP